MIGAALPTPALQAQASAPAADGAPHDAAMADAADTRKAGQTGVASGGGTASKLSGPAPGDDTAADRDFARLLAPNPAPDTRAPAATPAPRTAPERAAADPQPGQLPDQLLDLLDLFALLVPNAAPAAVATAPAAGAQAVTATPPAAPPLAGAAPQPAAVLAGRAVATEPGLPAVAGALAGAAPTATPTAAGVAPGAAAAPAAPAVPAHGPGTPAPLADATAPLPLALPAGTPPGSDDAVGADAFTRLVAEAAAGHDRLQGDPAAAQQLPSAPPAASTATRPAMPPHAPLPQPADPGAGYGDDFGKGVLWMTEKALGHAQLRVTPEHLGPIDVRLQLDGARVHAEFSSAQPEVRQALESSLPRLREMLGQHGLELAQADVGQRQQDPRPRPATGRGDGGNGPASEMPAIDLPQRRVTRGLLDEYA